MVPVVAAGCAFPIHATTALGVLGAAVAYIIYHRLMREAGATRTSLTTFVVPLFGVL